MVIDNKHDSLCREVEGSLSSSFFGHQIVKLLLRDHIIPISIAPRNHLLQKAIVSQLSQLLREFSELLETDLA